MLQVQGLGFRVQAWVSGIGVFGSAEPAANRLDAAEASVAL